MTTYNTGNPIGSTDARDLSDNAQNLDMAVNGSGSLWTDRLGNVRPTWNALAAYAGPAYDASTYGGLEAALTALGAGPATIQYTGGQTFTQNWVIPAGIELLPLNGAVINHGAYTISYAGTTARWPLAQIFNGTVAVTLTGSSVVYPEWFGDDVIKALNTGIMVHCVSGKTYTISGSNFIASATASLDLNGATLKYVGTASTGLNFAGNGFVKNGTLDNVWLSVHGTEVTAFKISGCKFINQVYNSTNCQDGASLHVDGNYFTGHATGPLGSATYPTLQVTKGAKNVSYTNNIAYDVEAGITFDGILGVGNTLGSIVVENNRFESLTYYALKVDVYTQASFKDNTVKNSAYGVFAEAIDETGAEISRSTANNLTVRHNDFDTVTVVLFGSGADNPYSRVIFADNYMNGCDAGVQRFSGATTIENNHFYNGKYLAGGTTSAALKTGNLRIVNNIVDTTTADAAPSTDLDGVAITAAIRLPSTVQDGGSTWTPHILLLGNTFRNFAVNAVQIYRTDNTGFPNLTLRDNLYYAGAGSTTAVSIGVANDVFISGERVSGTLTNNILIPTPSRVTGFHVSDNGWQNVPIAVATSPRTILPGETGDTFSNTGATGTVVCNLPAGIAYSNGLTYTFIRQATQLMQIDPNASQTIRGGTAGQSLQLNADGDWVTIKWFGGASGRWEIVGSKGTYTFI